MREPLKVSLTDCYDQFNRTFRLPVAQVLEGLAKHKEGPLAPHAKILERVARLAYVNKDQWTPLDCEAIVLVSRSSQTAAFARELGW